MLNYILSDQRLNNKQKFSIVLLPPFCSNEPYDYDYLANHVIHVPFQEPSCSNNDNLLLVPMKPCQCTHLLLYLDSDIFRSTHKDHFSSHILKSMIGEYRYKNHVLQIIDILFMKFSEASSHCYSLKDLRSCMQDILESGYHFIESICEDLIDKGLKIDDLCAAFESCFMEETYDVVFFKMTQLLLEEDQKLSSILDDLEYLDFSQISLPSYIKNERRQVQQATVLFEKIGSLRTPIEKLNCLLNTISELTRNESLMGTDAIVPLLLMTMIRSKLPHLIANLIYMKDFNFKRDVSVGLYGYSLSTFEGVLNFMLHSNILELSLRNETLWASIKADDLMSFEKYYCSLSFDPRDKEGNNALMMASLCGQTDILEYIIQQQGGVKATDVNDAGMTPLMCAIKSKSKSSISVLLQDPYVLSTLQITDNHGNSALMYACRTNDLLILKQLVSCCNCRQPLVMKNPLSGDTVLHLAASNHCSAKFMLYVLGLCHLNSKDLVHWKNNKGETFYHLCKNYDFLKYLYEQQRIDLYHILRDTDHLGRCPLMTWASSGRLDLIGLFADQLGNNETQVADHQGRTIIHMIAIRLSRGLLMEEKSLDFVIKTFRHLLHVQDWPEHNTALHLAVETVTPASVSTTISFIKAFQKYGGQLDVMNGRGERPIDVCRLSEIASVLDDLILNTSIPSLSECRFHCNYFWSVTRAVIKQSLKNENPKVYFIINSGQINRPETMKVVKRRLQDFLYLRQGLLYEMPELFLPALNDLVDPSDLVIPSYLLINSMLDRLQCFMSWIQHHPILCCHDLVCSFVRSSVNLEQSVIRNSSFSRRKLLLEKLQCNSLLVKDTILPLKKDYSKVLFTGRRIMNRKQDLQAELINTVTGLKVVIQDPVIHETIKVCANAMCNYTLLLPFLKACQLRHDLMNGILLSLQKSLNLIKERRSIEEEEDQRKRQSIWQIIFAAEEQERKLKVTHENKACHLY
ncbi:hypothetical protein G6F61_000794 [Rhizopus arrhizus]|nr:hypothetical protein G6F61_000794 [Rhizopus arrhizus]